MIRNFTFLFALALCFSSFAEDIDILINGTFETELNGTWSLVTSEDAVATYGIYEEIPSWTTVPKNRLGVYVSAVSNPANFTDVFVANANTVSLNPGDSCYLTYYARTEAGGQQLQPLMVSTDAVEGELTTSVFETRTLENAFNGMKKVSSIIAKAGTYQFAWACGSATGTYVMDNVILKTYDYQADGAPLISSFAIEKEEQGNQGVKQIIGRAVAEDLEGDNFTLSFSILSGGGSISVIDSASFIYTENSPGKKIFKVVATDANGLSSTATANYTVSDFDTSQLYFNEDVWALVRAENGYTNHASFVFSENDPNLPNVLLMGNSISIGYTPDVRRALAGKANVYRIPDNGGSTLDMFKNNKLWLGKTHWDVIHFNWGLHDLKYLLNNQLNLNGKQVVPVNEYAVNMDRIVRILMPEADHVIFATTSHIPSKAAGRKAGDEVTYNIAALGVMEKYSEVMVDDQYALTNQYPEHNNDGDVHFTATGKQRQANQVAAKIIEALDKTTAITKLENNSTDAFYYNSSLARLIVNENIDVKSINVYNSRGQKIRHLNASAQMDLSGLNRGLYVVNLKTKNNVFYTRKILK